MPIWSILNQPAPSPVHDEKEPAHLNIQTITGPCWCVHWAQTAVTVEPAATVAFRAADVPPLQRILGSEIERIGL